jgi:hypothetical protein
VNQPLQLRDLYSGSNYAWRWTIDEDFILFIDDPTFTFNEPGIYDVSLEITERSSGCSSIGDTQLVVSGIMDAGFDLGSICRNQKTSIKVTGNFMFDRIEEVDWVVNGISYVGDSIDPMITAPNLNVAAQIKTRYGCSANLTYADSTRVIPSIRPQIEEGQGLTSTFDLPSVGWLATATLRIGGLDYSSFPATHTFPEDGFYDIDFVYIDTLGCIGRYQKLLSIGSPELALFIDRITVNDLSAVEREFNVRLLNRSQVDIDSFALDIRGNEGVRIRESFEQKIPAGGFSEVRLASSLISDFSTAYCGQVTRINDTWIANGDELCIMLGENIGSFYPNPTDGRVQIIIDAPEGTGYEVTWINAHGNPVFTEIIRIPRSSERNPVIFATDLLPAGLYIVRFVNLDNPNDSYVRKLIVR